LTNSSTGRLRYRPLFPDWRAKLTIRESNSGHTRAISVAIESVDTQCFAVAVPSPEMRDVSPACDGLSPVSARVAPASPTS